MEVSRFRHLNISSQNAAASYENVTGPLTFLKLSLEVFEVTYLYTRRSMLIEAGRGASFQVLHFELTHDLYYHDDITAPGFPQGLRAYSHLSSPTYRKGQWLISKHIGPMSDDEREMYALSHRKINSSRLVGIFQEIRVLSHKPLLEHRNIVDLVGFTWEKDMDEFGRRWPILILRDADCGTLSDFFQLADVTSAVGLSLAKDVACGLDALHRCGIVHGDLKFENVLVFEVSDGCFQARVSDFGLSTIMSDLVDTDVESILLPGFTTPWEAPESYYSIPVENLPKVDVYTFGLLFCRLMTRGSDVFEDYKTVSPAEENEYDLSAIKKLKATELGMVQFAHRFLRSRMGYPDVELKSLEAIVDHSLHLQPDQRDKICDLLALLSTEHTGTGIARIKTDDETDPLPSLTELANQSSESIPENFFEWDKNLISAAKDDLVYELELRGQSTQSDESRDAAEAAYTLSSWYISGELGKVSYEKGLQWLVKAAEYGSIKAKAYVWNVHAALGEPFPNDRLNNLEKWLVDAVEQYEYPGESSLMACFPERLDPALEVLRTIFCGYGQDCFTDEWRKDYPLEPAEDFIQLVRQSGLGINELHDDLGMTWLHYAASMGAAEVVRLLLLEGSNPDILNKYEETPLYMACQAGHYEVVCHLLPVTKQGRQSPISTELEHLNKFHPTVMEDVAAKLFTRNPDINARDSIGRTSLNTILNMNGSRCMDAIRILLRYGADPLCEDDERIHPLSQAAVNLSVPQFEEVLKFVPQDKSLNAKVDALVALMECPALDALARGGKDYRLHLKDILTILVDNNVCQRYKERYHVPLLASASAVAPLELVRTLVSLLPSTAVTDFHPSSRDWSTPLQAATVENRPEVVDLLLHSGATPAFPYPTEWTPLFFAAIWSPEMVSSLLKHVFATVTREEALEFVNKLDSNGAAAFATAVAGGYFESASILVNYGANYQEFTLPYSAEDTRLMSVLGWSSYMAPQVAYLLSLREPAGFIIDNLGTTILHCVSGYSIDRATENECHQLLDSVLDRFSASKYANCRDDENNTPLHYAGRFAHVIAIEKLQKTFGAALDLQAINDHDLTALDEAELRKYHDVHELGRLARREYSRRTEKVIELLIRLGAKRRSDLL